MNLKKIIREEVDDWAWAKEDIYTFNIKKGDTVTVKNLGNEDSYINWLGDYGEAYMMGEYGNNITGIVVSVDERSFYLKVNKDKISFPLFEQMIGLSNGYESDEYLGLSLGYIASPTPITESEEDDWEWTRGTVLFDMEELKTGDKIRVHNVGSEEAFLNWLGMYANDYQRGKYGKNIEGTITYIHTNEAEVYCNGDTISFPKSRHMEKLANKEGYRGLYIKYEII